MKERIISGLNKAETNVTDRVENWKMQRQINNQREKEVRQQERMAYEEGQRIGRICGAKERGLREGRAKHIRPQGKGRVVNALGAMNAGIQSLDASAEWLMPGITAQPKPKHRKRRKRR